MLKFVSLSLTESYAVTAIVYAQSLLGQMPPTNFIRQIDESGGIELYHCPSPFSARTNGYLHIGHTVCHWALANTILRPMQPAFRWRNQARKCIGDSVERRQVVGLLVWR